MYAFEKSYEAGYRGYETDIRLTSDGKLVLFHDNSLDRCTNAKGSIEEKTMKEVAAIRTKEGRPLCTLQEFVDFFKDKHNDDLYIEFEIKTNEKLYTQEKIEEICDKIYKMVTANKPKGAVYLFTSADYRALRYLQQKYKTTDMLLITSKPVNDETIALCKAMGIEHKYRTISEWIKLGAKRMKGFQLRYIYFLDPKYRKRLTVPEIPFSKIDEMGAGMYKGENVTQESRHVKCEAQLEREAKKAQNP